MQLSVKIIDTKEIFTGKIIDVRVDTITENGRQAKREVIVHCPACCILPIDEDENTYLVRQYRHGVGKYLWELPAGKVDPGETPESCAVRELEEEIGARCSRLISLGSVLVSPAYCSEEIFLYAARISGFTQSHPDEGELLEVRKIPFRQLLKMIDNDIITDAKTVALALKYKRRQE